jgi:hypothetical protein
MSATATPTTSTQSRASKPAASRLGRAAAIAVPAAAVAAAAVHLLFQAAGANFVVAPGGAEPSTVTAPLAAAAAAIATAVGAAVAAVLARFARRPSRAFLILTAAVLIVTAANPVLAADQALTVVALELEHLAVAAVALFLLLPPLRARDRA